MITNKPRPLRRITKSERRRPESNREAQKGTGLKPVGVPLSHDGMQLSWDNGNHCLQSRKS